MTDCERKTIFGRPACRFEGRFDLSAADISGLGKFKVGPQAVETFMNAMRTETYVRDVCIKCGKTIERSKS